MIKFIQALDPSDPGLFSTKDCWVRSTRRKVYILDGQTVIKEYVHHPGRKYRRQPWRKEHKALIRLQGFNVPKSYGYCVQRNAEGRKVHVLSKEYIEGGTVKEPSETFIEDFARLLACIHRQRVITNDPALSNTLYTEEEQLYFIDFDKARTFHTSGPCFQFYVGKELSMVYLRALKKDAGLFRQFTREYYAYTRTFGVIGRCIIDLSLRYWIRYDERKRKRILSRRFLSRVLQAVARYSTIVY